MQDINSIPDMQENGLICSLENACGFFYAMTITVTDIYTSLKNYESLLCHCFISLATVLQAKRGVLLAIWHGWRKTNWRSMARIESFRNI